MRSCQLCGCASWGPIGNPAELDRLGEFVPTVDALFVRCDNCKSVARADLLQDSEFKPDDRIASPSQPLPDFITETLARVMPAVPAPPTRTERLVYQILQANPRGGGKQSSTDYAQWAVALARVIEWELDHPTGPSATEQKPWLTLSWSAPDEFHGWCVGMWDLINKSDGGDFTTTADYPDRWLDVAATYALRK